MKINLQNACLKTFFYCKLITYAKIIFKLSIKKSVLRLMRNSYDSEKVIFFNNALPKVQEVRKTLQMVETRLVTCKRKRINLFVC